MRKDNRAAALIGRLATLQHEIACPYCDGTGSQGCPTCKGTGLHPYPRPAAIYAR